jgi:hypothetical protein
VLLAKSHRLIHSSLALCFDEVTFNVPFPIGQLFYFETPPNGNICTVKLVLKVINNEHLHLPMVTSSCLFNFTIVSMQTKMPLMPHMETAANQLFMHQRALRHWKSISIIVAGSQNHDNAAIKSYHR